MRCCLCILQVNDLQLRYCFCSKHNCKKGVVLGKIRFLVNGILKEEKTAEEIKCLLTASVLGEVKSMATPKQLSDSLYAVNTISVYNAASDDYSHKVYSNPDKGFLTKILHPSAWHGFVISSILCVIYFVIFSISTITNPLLTVLTLQVLLGFAFYLVKKYEIYLSLAKFRLNISHKSNPTNKYYISSLCSILIVIKCDDIQSGVIKILNLAQNANALDISEQPIEYVDSVTSIEDSNQRNTPKLYSAKSSALADFMPVIMLINIVSFTLFYAVGKYS